MIINFKTSCSTVALDSSPFIRTVMFPKVKTINLLTILIFVSSLTIKMDVSFTHYSRMIFNLPVYVSKVS